MLFMLRIYFCAQATHSQRSKARGVRMFACWLVVKGTGFSLANLHRSLSFIVFKMLH